HQFSIFSICPQECFLQVAKVTRETKERDMAHTPCSRLPIIPVVIWIPANRPHLQALADLTKQIRLPGKSERVKCIEWTTFNMCYTKLTHRRTSLAAVLIRSMVG